MGKNSVAIIVGVAIALLLGAVIGIGAAIYAFTPSEYSVTYELDGGINDNYNPSTYTYGKGAELFAANKGGYLFNGWYTDSGLTNRIEKISTTSSGALTLYAGWTISTIGEEWDYTVSGEISKSTRNSPYGSTETITGTYSISQLMYTYDCGYYVGYDYSITTGFTVDSDSGYYYTVNDEMEWTYIGAENVETAAFGNKKCSVYNAMDDDSVRYTKYVGVDDGCLYRLTLRSTVVYVKYTETLVKDYDLVKKTKLDGTASYDLDVYRDEGITANGSGPHLGSYSAVLDYSLKDGTEFKGWYSGDNVLLSRSKYFTIGQVYTDYAIYCLNTSDPDYVFENKAISYTAPVSLTDVTWTFVDGTVKNINTSDGTLNYTFSDAGLFCIDYVGTDAEENRYCGTVSIIAGGMVKQTYAWYYGGEKYTEEMYIKYSDYKYYCNLKTERTNGSDSHVRQFVTSDDQYVQKLADDLMEKGKLLSKEEFAQFVLNFVQSIDYVSDTESKGCTEYWKYPVETLFECCGDCEDTSILYCSVMKACGYDTALFLYTGAQYQDNAHCACGVSLPEKTSGTYYEKDGKKYYYCETTATGWKVGDIPEGYSNARVVTV